MSNCECNADDGMQMIQKKKESEVSEVKRRHKEEGQATDGGRRMGREGYALRPSAICSVSSLCILLPIPIREPNANTVEKDRDFILTFESAREGADDNELAWSGIHPSLN